jgi:hypothetical protein
VFFFFFLSFFSSCCFSACGASVSGLWELLHCLEMKRSTVSQSTLLMFYVVHKFLWALGLVGHTLSFAVQGKAGELSCKQRGFKRLACCANDEHFVSDEKAKGDFKLASKPA